MRVAPNRESEKIMLKNNDCYGYLVMLSQSAKLEKKL